MLLEPYTVTISGTEREDGEAPYTWVVNAKNPHDATNKALKIHLTEATCVDLDDRAEMIEALADLEIEEVYEGLPPADCGYHWNDMRESAQA
ncbi:hypothetical protein [Nonomuraea candida]|uniref:hypothetical protein n=1 Tax=Nonomuraea candida TaxID=359159 RepID=UPI0005BCBE9A|nr:hypothetical protein [Nonomuraea candida]